MNILKVLIAVSLLGQSAFASTSKSLEFTQKINESCNKLDSEIALEWMIKEVTVTEVEVDTLNGEFIPNLVMEQHDSLNKDNKMDLGQIIMVTDQLIALGKKIWAIIEAGKPVITTNMSKPISVLPKQDDGTFAFSDMANWSMPAVKSYRVSYKNGWNSEVIGFTYTVYFQHSGTYNDVGAYITSLNVEASEIYVAWGFKFDATSALVGIANMGSSADPIASATVSIAYKASSWFSEVNTQESFFVTGKGALSRLR